MQITECAKAIYSQKKYPEIKFSSISEVENYLKAYVSISQKTGTFYSGITKEETLKPLGNISIKGTYLIIKNVSDENVALKSFDVNTRDKIWITLSILMQLGKAGYYTDIWKPFEVAQNKENEKDSISESASNIIPIEERSIINEPEYKMINNEKKNFNFLPGAMFAVIGIAIVILIKKAVKK